MAKSRPSLAQFCQATTTRFRRVADSVRKTTWLPRGCGRISCFQCKDDFPRSLCAVCGPFVPKKLSANSVRILAKTSQVSDQSSSSLLRLPSEIRTIIWNEVAAGYAITPRLGGNCCRGHMESLGWEGYDGRRSYDGRASYDGSAQSLMSTCRQICQEVTVLFYQHNTFCFGGAGHLDHFSKCLHPSYMSLIRRIYVGEPYPFTRSQDLGLLDGAPPIFDLLSRLTSQNLVELNFVLPPYPETETEWLRAETSESLSLTKDAKPCPRSGRSLIYWQGVDSEPQAPFHENENEEAHGTSQDAQDVEETSGVKNWDLASNLACLAALQGLSRMRVLVPVPYLGKEPCITLPTQQIVKEKVAILRRSEQMSKWEDLYFMRKVAEKSTNKDQRDMRALWD